MKNITEEHIGEAVEPITYGYTPTLEEEAAMHRPYSDLNNLRIKVGDLPATSARVVLGRASRIWNWVKGKGKWIIRK